MSKSGFSLEEIKDRLRKVHSQIISLPHSKGDRIYDCLVTMVGNKWVIDNLADGMNEDMYKHIDKLFNENFSVLEKEIESVIKKRH